jgi:hypothetical protein
MARKMSLGAVTVVHDLDQTRVIFSPNQPLPGPARIENTNN